MKPTREQMQELLRIVLATEPTEIDCDEFLARVGAYLDALGPGDSPPVELKAVSQHLAVCAECREEFDALVRARGTATR
jgi:predicted anti-sigma-YlaC factor YlaD